MNFEQNHVAGITQTKRLLRTFSTLITGVESDLSEGGVDAHKYVLRTHKPDKMV
jgi:hypothetical protein